LVAQVFIPTFINATAAPIKKRTPNKDQRVIIHIGNTNVNAINTVDQTVTRTKPNFCINQGDTGFITNKPKGIPNKASPNSPSSNPSRVLTNGIWVTQVPNIRLSAAKVSPTAKAAGCRKKAKRLGRIRLNAGNLEIDCCKIEEFSRKENKLVPIIPWNTAILQLLCPHSAKTT
jgi:hypothetical protein